MRASDQLAVFIERRPKQTEALLAYELDGLEGKDELIAHVSCEGEDARELAERLVQMCKDVVQGAGARQKFAFRCVGRRQEGAEPEVLAQLLVTLQSASGRDYVAQGDASGVLAQSLRHLEAMARVHSIGAQQNMRSMVDTNEVLRRAMDELRRENEGLRAENAALRAMVSDSDAADKAESAAIMAKVGEVAERLLPAFIEDMAARAGRGKPPPTQQ